MTHTLCVSKTALLSLLLWHSNLAVAQDEVPEVQQMSEKELTILYTKTNREIAELELKRALELNKERPLIPRLTVERLRSNLAIAQEQHRQAKSDEGKSTEGARLKHAVERVRLAKVDLLAADKLKEINSISDFQHRRIALKYDLAQLNLALMQHPKGYVTLVDNMQRQIDRLGEDYLALEQRIAKLEGSLLDR